MAQKQLDEDLLAEARSAVETHGSISEASRAIGIPRSTLDNRYKRALALGITVATPPEVELPVFPDDDIAVEEILDTMSRRFEKRAAAAAARKWFNIKLNTEMPVGICFIGDVHIDSNGCNIPLLRRDCEIMSQDGMYCLNLGDSSDGDWPGRLMRLHAQSDQSRATAHRLVDWFLNGTNLTYLAILIGNHDSWGEGAEILNRMNVQKIPMLDWTARFTVRFKNDRECKIIASHSFPGRSWINRLHSNQRQEMQEEAHIYASGHTHDWGIHQSENSMRNNCYWLLRARGYKFLDIHADRLGYQPQQAGATVCAVVDCQATSEVNFIQCFADLEEASEYLAWKRSR